MIDEEGKHATREAAKENDGQLYPAHVRAMFVFEPTERTPNDVDIAGFHLRNKGGKALWIVGDQSGEDETALFLLDPDQFATSRQLHAYLESVQSIRENAEDADTEPQPPDPESWRPGVI